jgi:hypothetical protein
MQVFRKEELLAGRYEYDRHVEQMIIMVKQSLPSEIRIQTEEIMNYLFYCREIRIDEYTAEEDFETVPSQNAADGIDHSETSSE